MNLWNLFCFPEINKLKLNPEEAAFIEKLFNDSCKLLKKTILRLIDFYECNRIVYNKLKHGLSILAGMKMTGPKGIKFPAILVYALDRREGKKPPCLCHKSKESFMPEGLEWYDTVSIVPYWRNTFEKHSEIMTDLRLIIEHLSLIHI